MRFLTDPVMKAALEILGNRHVAGAGSVADAVVTDSRDPVLVAMLGDLGVDLVQLAAFATARATDVGYASSQRADGVGERVLASVWLDGVMFAHGIHLAHEQERATG